MSDGFRLLATPTTLWFTGLVLAATAVLCVLSWRRSGGLGRIGLLELLRFVLVAAVLFTLNQPEWIETEAPTERPVVAVLWDDSGSMATQDVYPSGAETGERLTRSAWVRRALASGVWERAGERLEVVVEPFATGAEAGRSDLAAPLRDTLERHANLRAVVLLSDGDHNAGPSPVGVAMKYRTGKVPVYAAAVGAPEALPDVEVVAIDVPTFAIAGKALQVPFTIRNDMPRDLDLDVTLEAPGGEVIRKSVVLPAKGMLDDFVHWTGRRAGAATLTLRVPPQAGELRDDNNVKSVEIEIREEALRVLLVESYPRWEYRYLRNAMVRDPGVEVACLVFHPDLRAVGGGPHYIGKFPGKAELATYDVVFLGDVGVEKGQLTDEECRLLKGLVQQQASGLILMPGLRGYQASLLETELGELFPVELDPGRPRGHGSAVPGAFALTEAGRRSLLTKLAGDPRENARVWDAFPGFQWFAPVIRATAGSTVLAVHKTAGTEFGRVPLLATRVFGAGKILFMGTDSAWKWREGVEDRHHYRFWGQVARWMAYQRRMASGDSMRVFFTPDRPKANHRLMLNANVMDAGGAPLDNGTVTAEIRSPQGKRDVIGLRRDAEGEWGLFRAAYEPSEPGRHVLTVRCQETGAELTTDIDVAGVARERVGKAARPEVLEEIARVTRGESVTPDEFEGIVSRVLALPEPEPEQRRFRLWSDVRWGGLLVLLMTVFWMGRKAAGRI